MTIFTSNEEMFSRKRNEAKRKANMYSLKRNIYPNLKVIKIYILSSVANTCQQKIVKHEQKCLYCVHLRESDGEVREGNPTKINFFFKYIIYSLY